MLSWVGRARQKSPYNPLYNMPFPYHDSVIYDLRLSGRFFRLPGVIEWRWVGDY